MKLRAKLSQSQARSPTFRPSAIPTSAFNLRTFCTHVLNSSRRITELSRTDLTDLLKIINLSESEMCN